MGGYDICCLEEEDDDDDDCLCTRCISPPAHMNMPYAESNPPVSGSSTQNSSGSHRSFTSPAS